MKTITVVVPTFNEESNIINLYNRTKKVFEAYTTSADAKRSA